VGGRTSGGGGTGGRPCGSACGDEGRCRAGDRCDPYGTCTGTPPPCGRCETCDPAVGSCTPSPAGAPCDDDDACTTNDRCDGAGACASDPVACGPCETCDSASGCQVAPLESCGAAGTAL